MWAATVVMIHGAWLHATSWEPWCERLRDRGHTCLIPAWPYLEGDPADLREHPPAALEVMSLDDVVSAYAGFIETLAEPPVLIGHSFGGLVVLRLLDQGLGVAGIALEPAPPKHVAARGTALKSNLPVIKTWKGGQKVHSISFEHWAWSFGNGIPERDRQAVYDAYVIPAPGRPFFEVLWAGFHDHTAVDFANPDRAPLMLVAGTEDRTVPAKMVRRTWDRYSGKGNPALLQEFDRSHAIVVEPGWQEVLDLAISWVEIETGLTPEPIRHPLDAEPADEAPADVLPLEE